MFKIRKSWHRLVIVITVLLLVETIYVLFPEIIRRADVLKALQGTTLLFTLSAALSIALFSNYVKGLKKEYDDKANNIRCLLEEFLDKHDGSNDPDVSKILTGYVLPLLSLNSASWNEFNPVVEITPNLAEPAKRLFERNPKFIVRYVLRLEDYFNDLGVLFVRRVITELHMKTVKGTFLLIVSGITVLGFSYLFSHSYSGNFVFISVSLTTITFGILELFLLLSYILQEGDEEKITLHETYKIQTTNKT